MINQPMMVFASGVAGVFAGMGLLYCAIKLNTLITEWILTKGEGKT